MDCVENALTVPVNAPSDVLPAQVTRVFDGDGFLALVGHPRSGSTVELSFRCGFIDAPEKGQAGSDAARKLLTALIGNKTIYLAILTKSDTGGILDRHSRIVCVPFVVGKNFCGQAIWRNVELEMVVNGWAWVLKRYCPEESYLEALSEAQLNRRGIWAASDNVPPWEFKRRAYQKRRSTQQSTSQADLLSYDPVRQPCPHAECGGNLIEKTGRFGKFFGCSNYPRCKVTRNQ